MCKRPVRRIPLMTRLVFVADPVAKSSPHRNALLEECSSGPFLRGLRIFVGLISHSAQLARAYEKPQVHTPDLSYSLIADDLTTTSVRAFAIHHKTGCKTAALQITSPNRGR